MVRRGRRPSAALVPVLVLVLAIFSACGSDSVSSPPTGIDELVIPTPSIDPDDFVARIDNPYLPLEPGHRWVYRVTEEASITVSTMTITVRTGGVDIDGVRTTAVETVGGGADAVDYYAQDRSGNVWWLGRAGSWEAGRRGAEAGLAMPAHPRVGDGWREAYRPGVVQDRAQVASVADTIMGLTGVSYRHVVDLATTSDLTPDVAEFVSYAPRVGLIRSFRTSGPARLVELVSGP